MIMEQNSTLDAKEFKRSKRGIKTLFFYLLSWCLLISFIGCGFTRARGNDFGALSPSSKLNANSHIDEAVTTTLFAPSVRPEVASQQKFDRAMKEVYRAVLIDLDDTLTVYNRLLTDEAVDELIGLLRSRIPVGIVTARSLTVDKEGMGAQLIEVLERIKVRLAEQQMPQQYQNVLLQFLYLMPENGSYIVRGNAPGDKIDLGLISVARNEDFVRELELLVNQWAAQNNVTLDFSSFGPKEYTVTLRKLPPDRIVNLKRLVEELIRKHRKEYPVSQSDDSIDISPEGGGKGFAFTRFVDYAKRDHPSLQIKARHIVTIGDKGRRGGIDYLMLNREGGFSVDEFDPDSPQVDTPHILGIRGWPAAHWLLRNLKFEQRPLSTPNILVIAGPSGVGKSTFVNRLLKDHKDRFIRLIRTTTRPPNPKEREGDDYQFVTAEKFKEGLVSGELLFPRDHYGYQYGFARKDLFGAINSKKILLMEGIGSAMDIANAWPDTEVRIVGVLPMHVEMGGEELDVAEEGELSEALRRRIRQREPDISEDVLSARSEEFLKYVSKLLKSADLVIENTEEETGHPSESLHIQLKEFAFSAFPYLRDINRQINVGVSFGGTKVAVGLVDDNGQVYITSRPTAWRTAFSVDETRKEDADKLTGGIVDLIEKALRYVPLDRIESIGISTKGPLDRRNGQVVLGLGGKKIVGMPFEDYPLDTNVLAMLSVRYGWKYGHVKLSNLPIKVLHDGAAAVLGEVSPKGIFSAERDVTAVIIGTGIGIGVFENGDVYEGDPSKPNERTLGSLGRHLIYIPDSKSPNKYKYEYRGFDEGEKVATKDVSETFFAERIAGPWLSQHTARWLSSIPQGNQLSTIQAMRLGDVAINKLEEFYSKEVAQFNDDDKKLEVRILMGLTQAAKDGNRLAQERISTIGDEIGAALAEFIWLFKDRKFVERIVLVSTVAEKLGVGVPGETTDDLLLERIKENIRQNLNVKIKGTNKEEEKSRGNQLVSDLKIFRSKQDYQRELQAFVPVVRPTLSVQNLFVESRALPQAL